MDIVYMNQADTGNMHHTSFQCDHGGTNNCSFELSTFCTHRHIFYIKNVHEKRLISRKQIKKS